MIHKSDALLSLRPGAEWIIKGDEVEWLDTEQTQPTDVEIQAKVDELTAAEPLKLLRTERNQKLAETDWVVIKEREEGGSVSNFADWKTYRQALRDITDTYTSLDDVVWPEKP